jgi:crotonobetainyl-CoA:carnitine CoA-transferase CaiB-like acyl-CoA transferase
MSLLNGLKVLDFSTLLPGPYAALMLSDMGAEVLRVESPTRPDLVRALPPRDASGESAAQSYLNRGKKVIALDLKKSEAIEVVKQLVSEYDIVLEQFRPNVMARLGLGYEDLKKINPKLIYCSITGYGQTGPFKDRAGHDINYLALSGVADYSRRATDKPVPQGVQIADIAGGSHHAVMGILAAVINRQNHQQGQYLDISMTDCAFSLNAMFGAGYLGGDMEPTAEGNMLNGGGFYDYYETQDGRFMSVGSIEPQFLMQLCATMNLSHLAGQAASPDPKLAAEFKQALTDAFLGQSFQHWCEVFAKLDCCVEPVLTFAEASQQDNALQRGWVTEVNSGANNGVSIKQIANPIDKNAAPQFTGAKIGAHSDEVLQGLGYNADAIANLKAIKAVK